MARRERSPSPVKRRERESPRRRDKSSTPPPPRHRSSRRSDSPVKPSSSHRTRSSEREKLPPPPPLSKSSRSPERVKAGDSPPRSPSPRSQRLRRAQAEREEERSRERRRGRGSDKEEVKERGDGRRSERDSSHEEPSRRKRERSASPTGHRPRENRDSRSHSRHSRDKEYDEENIGEEEERNGTNDEDSVAKMKAAEEALAAKKEQPSFELSGKLAEETNRVKGVTLLFTEPPEARKPEVRWRLYVFKAGEMLNEPLYIHRQSCYLFGRERRVADIPTDHPSCSKQHAVIQYRQVEKEQPDGMLKKQTRPYLMDLGSTNGTYINDNRLEPQRYYELIEQDTIKFGNSSREYVILHENSAKGE